jgi:hypothetical protein
MRMRVLDFGFMMPSKGQVARRAVRVEESPTKSTGSSKKSITCMLLPDR